MRVLLADDQPNVRSALRLLLEQDSDVHVVAEVADSNDLMEQLGKNCPDLVLLDWELPGRQARELLPASRALYPHLLVIVLSSRLEARRQALAAGADAFVSKADTPERLLAAITECWHRQHTELRNERS